MSLVARHALVAALLATALPAGGVVGVAPAGAAACGRVAAAKAGRWFVSSPPLAAHSTANQALRGDARRLVAVGVDPADPAVVVVSDGERLLRSDDGGCGWQVVWQLPSLPAPDLPSRDVAEITSVDVAHVAGRSRVTVAVVAVASWMTPSYAGTYLVTSQDGRNGWASTGGPLTLTGVFDPLRGYWAPRVRSGANGTLYAAVPSPAGTVEYVRSDDSGRTWSLRGTPDATTPTSMTSFFVSPWDADELWEAGGATSRGGDPLTRLRHSTDGGVTWTPIAPWTVFGSATPSWTTLDVAWPRAGRPARLFVVGTYYASGTAQPAPTASWSGDGGRTFHIAFPGTRSDLEHATLAHTTTGDAIVVTPEGATFRVPCATDVPDSRQWRTLPTAPLPPKDSWIAVGPDVARASATSPPVVAVPLWRQIELLTVVR